MMSLSGRESHLLGEGLHFSGRSQIQGVTVGKVAFLLVLAACVSLLAGCSGHGRYGIDFEDGMPSYEQYQEQMSDRVEEYEPSQADIDEAIRESEQEIREQFGIGLWSCVYDETWNDDWHDDVLCSNGVETYRPYLREWDSFVEHWEIMESAAEYEAQLNARE